jgi:hypothetical protein
MALAIQTRSSIRIRQVMPTIEDCPFGIVPVLTQSSRIDQHVGDITPLNQREKQN